MDKCFLTGCDHKTEWQLPWFIENYNKHCKIPLVIADFGMTEDMLDQVSMYHILKCDPGREGWFKKTYAMASSPASSTVWLDTDCQVMSDPSPMFDLLVYNKLSLVKDRPWSNNPSRNDKGDWYNTGVVGFKYRPVILAEWYRLCQEKTDLRGDQEVLYWMMDGDPLKTMVHISELPHKYNVVRLDMDQPYCPSDPVIKHWTGRKGSLKIMDMMRSPNA